MKDIRRRTRKQHSAEEKIRVLLEGLRGEENEPLMRRRQRCSHRRPSRSNRWRRDGQPHPLATSSTMANRLVEQSHLPAKRTLEMLGIPRTTFYRWYDRYRSFGEIGLNDRRPHPGWVWNRIPDDMREAVVDLALEERELSPRELAIRFTDTKSYLLSEGEKDQETVRGDRFPGERLSDPQGA